MFDKKSWSREYSKKRWQEKKNDPEYSAKAAANEKQWRSKNKGYLLEYTRVWRKNRMDIDPDFQRRKTSEWRKANPDKYKRNYASTNEKRKTVFKDKNYARLQVHYAIKKGVLAKLPCIICGSGRSEAHHDDYSKPLDVLWFCRLHHEARHHYQN